MARYERLEFVLPAWSVDTALNIKVVTVLPHIPTKDAFGDVLTVRLSAIHITVYLVLLNAVQSVIVLLADLSALVPY